MANNDGRDWPVEKEIAISEADHIRLRRKFRLSAAMRERITEVMLQMMDEAERLRGEGWDEVARMCGFDTVDAMQVQGRELAIDWPGRRVLVKRKPPERTE